jgi:hypothetical protein
VAAALWLYLAAAAPAAPVQQVTVDLGGLVFQDGLDQSANSLPAVIEPAAAYNYSINATVHGTGNYFSIFGAGTPLATVLNDIHAGSASGLNATVLNPAGTLPLELVHLALNGTDSLLGTTIAAASDLDISLDAGGDATFALSRVSVEINGKHDTSNTLVIEPGSTLTVTAVLPPIPLTGTANSITTTTATLNGAINPDGAATSGSFEWGPTASYGYSIPIRQLPAGLGPVAVSGSLSFLTPGSMYHYAILAANVTGTAQSADMTFETEAPPPPGSPVVTTGGASNLGFTTATLAATVNPSGFDTSVVFQYGLDANYGSMTAPVDCGSGNGTVPVSGTLEGLQAGAVYHYRAVASNTNGVVNGLDATFQTTAGLPAVVITGSPTGVGLNGATISASVIPNGSDTTVTFEYGLSTAYGSTLEPALDAGAGSGQVMVSATLSGLKPGSIYHYRADATNSAGVVTGGDRIFSTTSVTFGAYGGKYSGLFLADPAAVETSGVFTVVIAPSGSFAATGKLGGKNVKFAGVFQNSGAAIIDLPHTGITAHLQLAGSGPGRGIAGTLSGSDNAVITAPLVPGIATPGLYTVRIPPPDDRSLPQGYGYGSLKVSPAGAVTFSGKLGDGTPVTAGSVMVTGSTFPLYVPLYRNAGALVGNVVFETSSNGVLDAGLAWFKPATPTSSAFSALLALYGSAYSPPTRNQPVIGVSGGDFVFTSGTEAFSQAATLSTSNRIGPVLPNPHKVKASIKTATGLFTGSCIDPATGKSVPFGGAFFQDTEMGYGVLATKAQPGAVTFAPGL